MKKFKCFYRGFVFEVEVEDYDKEDEISSHYAKNEAKEIAVEVLMDDVYNNLRVEEVK